MKIDSIVATWTARQVSRWLHELGLSAYSQSFVDNDISGEVLLALQQSDLHELGVVEEEHVAKLQVAIETLRSVFQTVRHVDNNNNDDHGTIANRFSGMHIGHRDAKMEDDGDAQCQMCGKARHPVVNLTLCTHAICQPCLGRHASRRLEDKFYVVDCPLCPAAIHRKDLEQVLDAGQMQTLEQLEIRAALVEDDQFRHCPNADCGHIFAWQDPDEGAGSRRAEETLFRCERCRGHFCLKCKCPFHRGVTCIGYRKQLRARYGDDWVRHDNSRSEAYFRRVGSSSKSEVKCERCRRFVDKPCHADAPSSATLWCSTCGHLL